MPENPDVVRVFGHSKISEQPISFFDLVPIFAGVLFREKKAKKNPPVLHGQAGGFLV